MNTFCEICGAVRDLDRHHVTPRRMGGTKDPAIHDESNLMTLCRSCHRNIHDGRWKLVRSPEGISVVDPQSGEQIMRRLRSPDMDVPSLFQLLNMADDSLHRLHEALPYLTDEQLVEAFSYTISIGKRSWLIQAAILYEAQRRSTYGEHSLEAIARRFEIGLRQAQKYALVWKVFFEQEDEGEENVNIDAILLDEPSWYVVAATETKDPESWLAYAQDRKMEDPRYSVATFRRDIQAATLTQDVADVEESVRPETALPSLDNRTCPWIRPLCTRSGRPIQIDDCADCEFNIPAQVNQTR